MVEQKTSASDLVLVAFINLFLEFGVDSPVTIRRSCPLARDGAMEARVTEQIE